MTEAFAATVAVIIPVMALAGVLELRTMRDWALDAANVTLTNRQSRVKFICWSLIFFAALWFTILALSTVSVYQSLEYLATPSETRSAHPAEAVLAVTVVVVQLGWLAVVPAWRQLGAACGWQRSRP